MFDLTPADSLPAGPRRFGAAYLRVAPTGETLDTILVAPGSERVLRYGEATMEMLRPLFARGSSHAVVGDRLYQGSQDAYVLRTYEVQPAPERAEPILEIRRTDVDPTLREGEHARAVEARVAAAPELARPGLRAMYDNQPVPGTRPAYAVFLGDALGNLWVQDFSAEGSARTWAVFTPEGEWLGTVGFPEALRPTHVLENRIAGVFVDPLGVEYVQVHRIVRGP